MGQKQTVPMQLPLPPMQWWAVVQGNNDNSGTHNGANAYAYDFAIAEGGSSKGAPVHAPARGKVVEVDDSTDGETGANYIKVELAPTERVVPIHIEKGSAAACGVKVGGTVEMGQQIATVGDVGTGAGNYHLHIALSNEPLPSGSGHETIPSEFRNYDASDDRGKTFAFVASGAPRSGQWVRRRSLWEPWRPLGGPVLKDAAAVVSPSSSFVDVYARGSDDRLWQRFWDGAGWSEWFAHDDTFRLASSPAVYARGPDHRDVYARGQDGAVHHKWWDGSTREWNGWYPLGGQIVGAPAAVAVSDRAVDVYARGTDDRLIQNFWDGSSWSGWFAHDDTFRLASSPAVYSSGPDHRDVYVRGQDGAVHHKWWDGKARVWNGWYPVGGQILGAPAVVSRKPNHVDVFARRTDGRVWQTFWDGSSWSGWFSHEDGFPATSTPATVSRNHEHVDLYTRGEDGRLWQKWWQA